MKKITFKIIIASLIIAIIASVFPGILLRLSGIAGHSLEINERLLFIGGFLSVFTSISLFSFFMNRVILKRIVELSNATSKVIDGNYDFTLEMKQNDEISDLTNNFNKMVKELQSNEYLNKEFIRNISHELKTPLSAIHGYAELINTSTLTPEEVKEYSYIIASESKRLSLLAKAILQISLIESQSIINYGDEFKISDQIRNVIQLMQLDWEGKNIEFDLELNESKVNSNKEITYQMWTNLISNAIKFSPNGSKIRISLENTENHISFKISNPGSISSENQMKIFNLFYMTEKSENRDSNGVGLTLVSKIINKLDGTISVSSQDGYVTFITTIPIL